jgi:hypothetical protein
MRPNRLVKIATERENANSLDTETPIKTFSAKMLEI